MVRVGRVGCRARVSAMMLPPDDVIARSRKRMQDRFYQLPEYVEKFIEQVEPQLPDGWRIKPWTINRCVTIRNSRNLVMQLISYEGIEDGYTWKIEDVDRK